MAEKKEPSVRKQTLLVCDFNLRRWHNGYRLKCSSPTGPRTLVAYPNDDKNLRYDLNSWLNAKCGTCALGDDSKAARSFP